MKQCSSCGEFFPLTYFYRRSDNSNGYRSLCRVCHSAKAKIKNATAENIEKRRERHRKHARFKNYGMTKEQFDEMLIGQNGMCLICGSHMDIPNIDHDHKTGVIRGLLCHGCNTGLGLFKENVGNLEKAIEYLRIRS